MSAQTPATHTHIYALLDRSGSMESIASDVVGGFNRFIKNQVAAGPDARVTLVQFDSDDPQEVIASAVPIPEIVPLDMTTFIPRGSTPLLDATGQLITRARMNQELREANNLPAEDIIFVTVTDGEENASREFTVDKIRRLVAECEKQGWTFVFLSAALDAYSDATRVGLKQGNIQAFDSSADGVNLAFDSLSRNLTTRRSKRAMGEVVIDQDFFNDKAAEDHRRGKS